MRNPKAADNQRNLRKYRQSLRLREDVQNIVLIFQQFAQGHQPSLTSLRPSLCAPARRLEVASHGIEIVFGSFLMIVSLSKQTR